MKLKSVLGTALMLAMAAVPGIAQETALAQAGAGPDRPAGTAGQPQSRGQGAPTGIARFQRAFGGAGLLTVWSSYDLFGAVQSRVNGGLSHYASANAGGPATGYRDSVSTLLVPLSAMKSLSDGKSFLNFNLTTSLSNSKPNLAYSKGDNERLTISYLRMPTGNFAWSLGLIVQGANTDLRHNGGNIDADTAGIRGDLLYVFGPHWAATTRLIALKGETTTDIPTPVGTVSETRDTSQIYWQSDLVGTFTDRDWNALGDGWVAHPSLYLVTQNLTRDATTNSRGADVAEHKARYGAVGVNMRIEKPVFAPGAWSPQFELGLRHEYENTTGSYSDEPNYVTSLAGLGRRIGKGGFFNLAYAREDGFHGNRRSQTFKAIYSMNF